MVDITPRDLIVEWLARLAVRCVPKNSKEDIEVIVRTYAAPMAADIPAAAFTAESLEAVARQFPWFPPYAGLRKAIDKWLKANQPQKAVPAPGVDLPAADRCMVGFWNEYRAGTRTLYGGPEHWLDTFRMSLPQMFNYITNTDPMAAEIAVKRGWRRERVPRPSEAEREAVSQAVADYTGKLVVPPSERATPGPARGQPASPPPRTVIATLRPEQLHAIRMANPALRPIAEREAARIAALAGAKPPDTPTESEPQPRPEGINPFMPRPAGELVGASGGRVPMPWDELP